MKMKKEIMNHLQSGNKLAWYILAGYIASFVGQMKKTTKEIVLPLVLGEGGTFIPSYPLNTKDITVNGKLIPKFTMIMDDKLHTVKRAVLDSWLIQVANNMVTGNYSAFGDTIDQEWVSKNFNSCKSTGLVITTIKQAMDYLNVPNHSWKSGKTRLHRYIEDIEKSTKNVKRKAFNENKEVSFAEKQSAAPSINAEALKVLIDSGISAADAIKMLQG